MLICFVELIFLSFLFYFFTLSVNMFDVLKEEEKTGKNHWIEEELFRNEIVGGCFFVSHGGIHFTNFNHFCYQWNVNIQSNIVVCLHTACVASVASMLMYDFSIHQTKMRRFCWGSRHTEKNHYNRGFFVSFRFVFFDSMKFRVFQIFSSFINI